MSTTLKRRYATWRLCCNRCSLTLCSMVLPERPPAEPWVAPAGDEGLLHAATILGSIAQIVTPHSLAIDANDYASAEEAILSIVTRHPMTELQLVQTLARWPATTVRAVRRRCWPATAIHAVVRYDVTFFAAAPYFRSCPTSAAHADPRLMH